MKVGILVYNLCAPTAHLLNRIGSLPGVDLTVYPLEDLRDLSLLDAAPRFRIADTAKRRRHISLMSGTAREVMMFDPAPTQGLRMVGENDAVVSLGVQSIATLVLVWYARLHRRPCCLVVQFLGPNLEISRSFVIRFLKRITLWKGLGYVAQTPPTIETLTSIYRVPAENIVFAPFTAGYSDILRNSVRWRNVTNDRRLRRASADETVPVILAVGTLHQLKGFDLLVQALSLLTSLPWTCVIAGGEAHGETGYLVELQNLAKTSGVSSRVEFAGKLAYEELFPLYHSSDVYVCPSRKDTWPKTIVEASVAQLPIVVADTVGSAGVLVRNDVNGFVFQSGNPSELAECLGRLIQSAELRERMGLASEEIVAAFCNESEEIEGIANALGRLSVR